MLKKKIEHQRITTKLPRIAGIIDRHVSMAMPS